MSAIKYLEIMVIDAGKDYGTHEAFQFKEAGKTSRNK